MSGRSKSQDRAMAYRRKVAEEGEPLCTKTRRVQDQAEFTLSHTIPSAARDVLRLSKGDELQIEIYDDGYFVSAAEPHRENGSE